MLNNNFYKYVIFNENVRESFWQRNINKIEAMCMLPWVDDRLLHYALSGIPQSILKYKIHNREIWFICDDFCRCLLPETVIIINRTLYEISWEKQTE